MPTQKDYDDLAPGDIILCNQTETEFKIVSFETAMQLDGIKRIDYVERMKVSDFKPIVYANKTSKNVFILDNKYFINHCTILSKKKQIEPSRPKITFILGKED